ncbi:MAG TPA: hypothetical protein VLB73_03990 [Patescibacteria group bacterium]|nr:hypothetical protein [Patescibacteria group bacterium]
MGKVKTIDVEKEAAKAAEKAQKEAERLAKIEEAKARANVKEEVKPEPHVILNDSEGSQSKNKEEQSAELDSSPSAQNDKKETKKVSKYAAKQKTKGRERSENYKKATSLVEKSKHYSVKEALALLDKTHLAKFDETVELHINTVAEGISGQITLPHGTGKTTRVAILAPSKDAKAADELLKKIEAGKIDFDVLVATPDAMPKLAKVAKVLGPKGLMPNPKAGTVTPNPEAVAKSYEGGQIRFKTEAKAPIMHLTVGKLSFGADKLSENIEAMLKAVKMENVKKVTLKSTMSPAIKLLVK